MKKDCPFQTKKECRELLMQRRGLLSEERRQAAKASATAHLIEFCRPFSYILSFASLPDEIDLWTLNQFLAKEKKLLLPTMSGQTLQPVPVLDLAHLHPSKWSIQEPAQLSFFDFNQISCVLVPGLGFDLEKQRIGYGKGYYDHFLKQLPHALKVGIGFREQLIHQIPIEPHDQQLDQLFLF